jgi:hypothetical protein
MEVVVLGGFVSHAGAFASMDRLTKAVDTRPFASAFASMDRLTKAVDTRPFASAFASMDRLTKMVVSDAATTAATIARILDEELVAEGCDPDSLRAALEDELWSEDEVAALGADRLLDQPTRYLIAGFAFSLTAAKLTEIYLTHPELIGHLLNMVAILGVARAAAATTYRRLP